MKESIVDAEFINEKIDKRKRGIINFTIIVFSIVGITATFLLFPSYSKLTIFAKGEFAYLESVGIIFTGLTILLISTFSLTKTILLTRIRARIISYVLFALTIGIGVFSMLVVITLTWIRYDVKTHCEDAKKDYGGTCVEALSYQLDDTNKGFRLRNSAIWTLGQLAKNNSLPILYKYYTGNMPKKEPLNKTISQYELAKAIRWCEKGNITSWMYGGF